MTRTIPVAWQLGLPGPMCYPREEKTGDQQERAHLWDYLGFLAATTNKSLLWSSMRTETRRGHLRLGLTPSSWASQGSQVSSVGPCFASCPFLSWTWGGASISFGFLPRKQRVKKIKKGRREIERGGERKKEGRQREAKQKRRNGGGKGKKDLDMYWVSLLLFPLSFCLLGSRISLKEQQQL